MHAHSVQTTVVVKAGPFGASGYHVQHKVCFHVEVARHRGMVVSAGTLMSSAFKPQLRMLIQKHNMFQTFINSDGSVPSIQNRKSVSLSIMPFWFLDSCRSALELAVLTILRPHFRIQNGASLVSAEELEALATLSPRDEAGQRRVQMVLRRQVMSQHVDRPGWLHFLVAGKTLSRRNFSGSRQCQKTMFFLFGWCTFRPFLQCGDLPKCASAPLEV